MKTIEDIFLDEYQRKVFDKFIHNDVVNLSRKEFYSLYQEGLLKSTHGGSSSWFDTPNFGEAELSDLGKKYRTFLIDQSVQKHREKKQSKRESCRFWISLLLSGLVSGVVVFILQAIFL